jgi:hypothetical protein
MWNDHSLRGTWSARSLSALPKAGAAKVFRIAPFSRAAIGQDENAAKGRIKAIAAADTVFFWASEKGEALESANESRRHTVRVAPEGAKFLEQSAKLWKIHLFTKG